MQGRALRPFFTLCPGREENGKSRAAGDVAVMSAIAVFARVNVAWTGSAVFLQKTAPGGFHVELKPIFLSKDDHPEQVGAFASRVKIKRPLSGDPRAQGIAARPCSIERGPRWFAPSFSLQLRPAG